MLVPTAIANLDRVRSLVVNAGSSGSVACAVRDDASVTCWGFTGRVPGYPVGQRVSAPTAPAALTDVAALSFESLHKCAVARSGTVACWDFRPWDETYPLSITPMMLDGIVDARGVTGGGRHLCVLSRRGTVVCIGDNNYGQLGDGSMTASPRSFVSVRGLTDAVAITSGAGIGMAALRADGTVVTWGSFYANRRALAAVPGLQSIVDVSAGLDTFCARRADGAVFCWGGNNHGQLGNDSQRESQTPVRIAGFGP